MGFKKLLSRKPGAEVSKDGDSIYKPLPRGMHSKDALANLEYICDLFGNLHDQILDTSSVCTQFSQRASEVESSSVEELLKPRIQLNEFKVRGKRFGITDLPEIVRGIDDLNKYLEVADSQIVRSSAIMERLNPGSLQFEKIKTPTFQLISTSILLRGNLPPPEVRSALARGLRLPPERIDEILNEQFSREVLSDDRKSPMAAWDLVTKTANQRARTER